MCACVHHLTAGHCTVSSASAEELARDINHPNFPHLLARFLFDQAYAPDGLSSDDVDSSEWPEFDGRLHVHGSAAAVFYAPSELAGPHGMHREHIRSTPLWNKQYMRRDTALIQVGSEDDPMGGMLVGRVVRFLAFTHDDVRHHCALVEWLIPDGDERDDVTGMWKIIPELDEENRRVLDLVPVESIVCACHLMPQFGDEFLPSSFEFSRSLSVFRGFYLNHYADFHARECTPK
jgi:hypothetical protein